MSSRTEDRKRQRDEDLNRSKRSRSRSRSRSRDRKCRKNISVSGSKMSAAKDADAASNCSKNAVSAPKITKFEWGAIEVEHRGKNVVFKDAILTPNGAKSWNWKLDGTRHKPGVTKEAIVLNKLCEDADVVIVTRGVKLVLQTKDETKKYLESAKENGLIKDYMILQSHEAVAEYGRLIEKGQKVAGLFHSTC